VGRKDKQTKKTDERTVLPCLGPGRPMEWKGRTRASSRGRYRRPGSIRGEEASKGGRKKKKLGHNSWTKSCSRPRQNRGREKMQEEGYQGAARLHKTEQRNHRIRKQDDKCHRRDQGATRGGKEVEEKSGKEDLGSTGSLFGRVPRSR